MKIRTITFHIQPETVTMDVYMCTYTHMGLWDGCSKGMWEGRMQTKKYMEMCSLFQI